MGPDPLVKGNIVVNWCYINAFFKKFELSDCRDKSMCRFCTRQWRQHLSYLKQSYSLSSISVSKML